LPSTCPCTDISTVRACRAPAPYSACKTRRSAGAGKQRCGLQDSGRKFIGSLSKGYQQRVGIAQAIIHNPAVVVLDEPTVGLDPAQIRDIRTLIRQLGDSSSVILSTHLLNEAESLCDRVIILQKGRLIYSGSSAEMLANGNMEDVLITKTMRRLRMILSLPKEFRSLFNTPSTWWMLALMQFLFAWIYLGRVDDYLQVQAQLAQLDTSPGATISVAAPLCNVLALMLMILIPLFTMRLIAEERRNQTWVLLLSAPVSATQIVLGKFLGLLLLLVLIVRLRRAATLLLGTNADIDLMSSIFWDTVARRQLAALGLYFRR
jgi:hypothetical protein